MNPNIYLAYMVFLGADQEKNGTARELSESFIVAKNNGLFNKMGWNSNFERLVHMVAYNKYLQANSDFILEAKQAWSKANSKSFIEFLKKYGFKT